MLRFVMMSIAWFIVRQSFWIQRKKGFQKYNVSQSYVLKKDNSEKVKSQLSFSKDIKNKIMTVFTSSLFKPFSLHQIDGYSQQ